MSDIPRAKITKIIRLLKFLLTVEDKEILKSSIESIVEMLEEEVK